MRSNEPPNIAARAVELCAAIVVIPAGLILGAGALLDGWEGVGKAAIVLAVAAAIYVLGAVVIDARSQARDAQ